MSQAVLNRSDRVMVCLTVVVAFVAMFTLSAVPASHAAPSMAASNVSQPLELARVHVLAGRSVRSVAAF